MAEDRYRVERTASFLERLDAIEAFLTEADAAFGSAVAVKIIDMLGEDLVIATTA